MGQQNDGKSIDAVALQRCPHLRLRLNTAKGRGVFATARIPSNTTLEVSPVLILDPEENKAYIEKTSLFHYTYNWPIQDKSDGNGAPIFTQAVVLGLGSMFNHSRYEQNVVWRRDLKRQVVVYSAARDISEGEELCISYGDRLTFVDVDEAQMAKENAQSEESEFVGLSKIDLT